MLPNVEEYLRSIWPRLPGELAAPRSLTFLGQATGVTKACMFVFVDRERLPRYIVKLARSPLYNSRLIHEVSAIQR
jgi:hypothetical protein